MASITTYRVLLRLTNNIQDDASYWNGRTTIVKMHSNRYLYFGFADARSGNHNFNSPSSLFDYYTWYYVTVSVDYLTGKYSAYVYNGVVDEQPTYVMWSYIRSVTAREHYETNNHGLHKDTAYLMIGGDRFYNPWHGYIKNMKFFYGDAI